MKASKAPKGEVYAGLRILAKIIAREVVHQQLGKIGGLAADPGSADPILAQVSDYAKGVTRE